MGEQRQAMKDTPTTSPSSYCDYSNYSSGFPAHNEEEEAVYDFQAFVTQLKDPRADPILRYTRSFLTNFTTKRDLWTCDEQRKLVDDFKVFAFDKLRLYEPFKSLDSGRLKNAQEGIEKLIMGKLYNQCFSPSLKQRFNEKLDEGHNRDLLQDALLEEKRAEYRFIDPEFLEFPQPLSNRLQKFSQLAGKELSRVNEYKAPRDKMVCILNACRVLFGFLKHSGLANGGADEFVPVLVYTLLKSDVKNLVSNLNYIERFRFAEFLQGESSYYLSSVQGASNFVATLGRESLQITDPAGFEARYRENQEALEVERARIGTSNPTPEIKTDAADTPARTTSPGSVPSEYIRRPLDEATSAIISKFSELFASNGPTADMPQQIQDTSAAADEDAESTRLVQELQNQENKRVLRELHSMFPDMDEELIFDVCEAKKYRIGVCVDTLLTLSS
ncbi:LADA_0D12926g1_1 [Lachancea dasiensis]|uniref:LADA_0D12926g1_1 n=1 Tax=Lachancea dasiensis TaxID=1072105 RepID=A0A1G4J8E2_9SACH|nr:LADA_0D12926g1_1 [Lachancea dasiensis]